VKQLVARTRDGVSVISEPMPDDEAGLLQQQNFSAWTDPKAVFREIRIGRHVLQPTQVANMTTIEAGATLPPFW